MTVSSYCKAHRGQERECERCPGPDWVVLNIEMTCNCKCHEKGK